MNSRIDLAYLFNDLGFKTGAEVGVAKGAFSETLCKTIPDLKLYCIDTWKKYHGIRRGRDNEGQQENFEIAQDRLKGFNVEFMRMRSMDAVKIFEDESLDFVFIDANHDYKYVKEDIEEWSKKVRLGGIVACHDYYHFNNSGVVEAVDEYTDKNRITVFLTTPDPKKNAKDDRQPCAYWYKE